MYNFIKFIITNIFNDYCKFVKVFIPFPTSKPVVLTVSLENKNEKKMKKKSEKKIKILFNNISILRGAYKLLICTPKKL